ncbi:MAG TPA: hypothetical protein VF042_04555 [Gemmatimonadaceae bacterium]
MRTTLAALIALVSTCATIAHAQLDPSDHWRTIETTHFHIHFPRGLDSLGLRAAVNAERAFAELSTELRAPKGKIDLVVADNVDYVNGYATSFPSNRIVVFAHPPIDAPELRNYDDWLRLVVTHELTHVFHLDRADGVWRLGRSIFGRHPALFPNAYLPSWVIEGLAVYYESRITGGGRLAGSEHYMIARAAAEANRVPRVDQLSLATTRFPGGETVYSYGSLIFDYLSRTRGPDKIPLFIDKTSKLIWPVSLNGRAKKAFGISFENAWRDWRDSIVRVSKRNDPLPGWRELTHEGRYVSFPRWLGDTAILYTAANGREVTSAYRVNLDGEIERLGRRNNLDVNVQLLDGSIYFTQPDFTDAFHYRNDLYVQRDGHQTRLTKGARLTQIDVNASKEIVAVQNVPGSTILVLVSPDGKTITPITEAAADIQWAEPRWSPDGNRIAAIRIVRGGTSELVVMNQRSRYPLVVVSQKSIVAQPSWSRDGTAIYYTSTISGATQVYRIPVTLGTPSRISSTSTGFFFPELSADGNRLAGLDFRYDGYHLGVGPIPRDAGIIPDISSLRPVAAWNPLAQKLSDYMSLRSVAQPRDYSPWRSLAPRYWEPIFTATSSGDGVLIGAATSGNDVIGRHSYYVQADYDTEFKEAEGFGAYQYAGLGQPFLTFSGEQDWDHFGLFAENSERVGNLTRRIRTAGVSASFTRPRARTFSALSFGADVESRSYTTDPDTLLSHLAERFQKTRNYPSLFASASFANTKRPGLSISREDGIAVGATVRQRWESGEFAHGSWSVLGTSALYKSLDLPGFAHHVVALRAAGGYADDEAISTFSVGGLSGGSLDILEGVELGTGTRTFGVRGFPPSSEQGIRALGGTAEYRAPLAAPGKRIPFIPLLFDRISMSVFGEAGRAFCPISAGTTDACRRPRTRAPWLASVGGEIDFDTAVQYDFPARFRLGLAVPVAGREPADANRASVYFTAGSAF